MKDLAKKTAEKLRRSPCIDTLLFGLITKNLLTVETLFSPFVENFKDFKLAYLLFLSTKEKDEKDEALLEQVLGVAEAIRDQYKKEEGAEDFLLSLISLPKENWPFLFKLLDEENPNFSDGFERNLIAFIKDEDIIFDFRATTPDFKQDMFSSNSVLDEFGTNLNLLASKGEYDDLIPYDDTIEELYTVLLCKKKPNVILTGVPGCGKTSLVELLARNIVEGNAPEALRDKVVYSVDLARMVGGSEWRGIFEARLTNFVDEIKRKNNVIIFIDEIHTLVGAGGNAKTELEASNMLKPALADGSIMCIGATTPREYDLKIKEDPALDRRFKKIRVFPPSSSKMSEILPKMIEYFSAKHEIGYTQEFINNVVKFCDENLPQATYPDKLVDVIDFCAAKAKINGDSMVTEDTLLMYTKEEMSVLENFEMMRDLRENLNGGIIIRDNVDSFFNAVLEANVSLDKPNVLCLFGEKGVGKSFFLEKIVEQFRICGADVLTSTYLNLSFPDKVIGRDSLAKNISFYRSPVVVIDDYDKIMGESVGILENGFKTGILETITGEIVSLKSCTFILSVSSKNKGIGFKDGGDVPSASKDILSLSKIAFLRGPNELEKEIFFQEKMRAYNKKGFHFDFSRPIGDFAAISKNLREKISRKELTLTKK